MAESLQPALPREMYVDDATWRDERDARAVRRVVLRRAPRRPGARPEPARRGRRRRGGRERAGDQRRRRPAARGVQRLPAPRLAVRPVDGRAGPRAAACAASPCAAPTTPGPTASTAGCCARRTPTRRSTPTSSRCTGRRRHLGRVRLRPPHARERADPLAEAVAGPAASLASYALGDLVTGAALTYEVAANYKVLLENYNECYHCGPVHPELCRLVPAFAGGGDRPRLGRGHPAPRGRLDLHADRHHDARAAPGPDRGRADPAQGRPRLPEPDAVRVRRPRRGVRAAAAGRRPHHRGLLAAVRRRRGGRPGLRPRRRRASCGTWSTARTGRSASRCSAACPRAATGTAGSRRWRTRASTSGAGCCPASPACRARRRGDDRASASTSSSPGSARSAAPPAASSRGAATRGRAGAVRARARPRRQPRHQPDPAAQLPHARLRPADPARRTTTGPARARHRRPRW